MTGDVPTEAGVTPAELSCGLLVNLQALQAGAPALDRFGSVPAGVMLVLSLQISIKLA